MEQQIQSEIYRAFELLGADRELLAAVGSWGDTLDNEAVLSLLRGWVSRYVSPDRKLFIC